MTLMKTYLALLGFVVSACARAHEGRAAINAKVSLDISAGATVIGRRLVNVESFNAIPYADPPVGPLRFKPPRKLSTQPGIIDGTVIAPACPQMPISSVIEDVTSKLPAEFRKLPFYNDVAGQEDCLTLNVQRPADTKADAKLPVLFWIYGGGYQFGSTNTYDGTSLLQTAMGQNQPFIYVTANYRLSAFGFMPGKEILQEGSSNAGILDQRMALEWVADNIHAFGGDPEKVTLWGESAGSASVLSQMLLYGGKATYKGKPLFRGGIMDSGTVFPSDPVDCPKGQAIYDQIARDTGCSGAQDTLECLRRVDYNVLHKVVSTFPQILSYHGPGLVFHPRPDGNVLISSPELQAKNGQLFAVPIIVGHQEDEGTLLGLFQKNVTTPADMANYLHQNLFSHAPPEKLRELVDMYEPALVQGTPYRTGPLNELYPGFKRVAATIGDIAFILTRRLTLEYFTKMKPEVPVWSYQASYFHGLPFLGTFHTSDLVQVFYGIPVNYAMKSARTYYFNFLYNLDPNTGVGGFDRWPDWREDQQLMWFKTPSRNSILKDDFRKNASDWLDQNIDVLRT